MVVLFVIMRSMSFKEREHREEKNAVLCYVNESTFFFLFGASKVRRVPSSSFSPCHLLIPLRNTTFFFAHPFHFSPLFCFLQGSMLDVRVSFSFFGCVNIIHQ